MGRTWRRLSAAVVLSIAAACTGAGENAQTAQQPTAGLPEGHPPITGGATASAQGPGGVVMEKVDGGGYTYVRLTAGDQEIWVAGPVTAIEVGDTVMVSNPMSMGQFTSKALNRTFDNLYFADAFVAPGAAGTVAPSSSDAAQGGVKQASVAETMNSGGYTYVRISVDGNDVWLAGPETQVKEGDAITWTGGMVMRGFTSSTLKRTFDEILFVNQISVVTPS